MAKDPKDRVSEHDAARLDWEAHWREAFKEFKPLPGLKSVMDGAGEQFMGTIMTNTIADHAVNANRVTGADPARGPDETVIVDYREEMQKWRQRAIDAERQLALRQRPDIPLSPDHPIALCKALFRALRDNRIRWSQGHDPDHDRPTFTLDLPPPKPSRVMDPEVSKQVMASVRAEERRLRSELADEVGSRTELVHLLRNKGAAISRGVDGVWRTELPFSAEAPIQAIRAAIEAEGGRLGFDSSGAPVVYLPKRWKDADLEQLQADLELARDNVAYLQKDRQDLIKRRDAQLKCTNDLISAVRKIGGRLVQGAGNDWNVVFDGPAVAGDASMDERSQIAIQQLKDENESLLAALKRAEEETEDALEMRDRLAAGITEAGGGYTHRITRDEGESVTVHLPTSDEAGPTGSRETEAGRRRREERAAAREKRKAGRNG